MLRSTRRTRDAAAPELPVAVITGAASGIGAACAELMRRLGWHTAGVGLNPSLAGLPLRADVAGRAAVAAAGLGSHGREASGRRASKSPDSLTHDG